MGLRPCPDSPMALSARPGGHTVALAACRSITRATVAGCHLAPRLGLRPSVSSTATICRRLSPSADNSTMRATVAASSWLTTDAGGSASQSAVVVGRCSAPSSR